MLLLEYYKTAAQGCLYEACGIMHLKLTHDIHPVALYGRNGKEEFRGDFSVGIAFGYEL